MGSSGSTSCRGAASHRAGPAPRASVRGCCGRLRRWAGFWVSGKVEPAVGMWYLRERGRRSRTGLSAGCDGVRTARLELRGSADPLRRGPVPPEVWRVQPAAGPCRQDGRRRRKVVEATSGRWRSLLSSPSRWRRRSPGSLACLRTGEVGGKGAAPHRGIVHADIAAMAWLWRKARRPHPVAALASRRRSSALHRTVVEGSTRSEAENMLIARPRSPTNARSSCPGPTPPS